MSAGANAFAHPLKDVARTLAIKKGDMLFPGEPDQNAQTIFGGNVEQPARRDRIDADGVKAARGHLREISTNLFGRVIFTAVGLGAEGAVGDASDVEFFIAREKEFSANDEPG